MFQEPSKKQATRQPNSNAVTKYSETQERSFKVLKKGGILVSLVQPPSQELATKYGVRALFYGGHASAPDLAEIAKLIDDGKVKPTVGTVLPLADARRAHELSETGHARGKIVLKVAGFGIFHPKQTRKRRN